MGERTCSVEDCGRVDPRAVLGMCTKHYQRFRLHGTTADRPPRQWTMCSHPHCSRQARRNGLCRGHTENPDANVPPAHYLRANPRHGAPYCAFSGCDGPHKTNGLCREHKDLIASGAASVGNPQCSWRDCRDSSVTRGLCAHHVYYRYLALRQYGMTIDRYESLLSAQSGGCAICGGVNANGNWLAVDHDHSCCPAKGTSCGRCVRALLCASCNLMIGHSGDAAERLRSGAEYLDRWNAREVMRAV